MEATLSPKVSVIILNFKKPKDTLACVESVAKSTYKNVETIIVDNNVQDTAAHNFLKEQLKCFNHTLINSESNSGYAGGNNRGILSATGNYFFLLNDDVLIDPDLIKNLATLAQQDTRIGIIGPVTLHAFSGKVWFYPANISNTKKNLVDVPMVVGAAFMIKKTVIQEIGLLDENFYLYHEELDWCMRAKKAGYRIVCAPHLNALHTVTENASESIFSPHKAYYLHRNLFLIAAKHYDSLISSANFLFKHLVYYGKGSLPITFLFEATKRRKMNLFEPYFKGLFDGVILFLKLRLNKSKKRF